MFEDYENRCADCSSLCKRGKKWYCYESCQLCSETNECPTGIAQCTWCKEYFTEDELFEEVNLGLLCNHCIAAIKSRGEDLTIRM